MAGQDRKCKAPSDCPWALENAWWVLAEAELRHVCPVQFNIKRTSNLRQAAASLLKFRLTRLIGRVSTEFTLT